MRQNIQESLLSHYQNIDPQKEVGNSKQSFFRSALEYLTSEIRNDKRSILDVGCGYGYFLELARRRGWHTSGVEILAAAVKDSREKVGTNNIFNGPLKEAQYLDNSFGAITLWDVLFMIEDPFEELIECYRILKDNGIIGIRVRNVFFEKMARQVYSFLKRLYPPHSVFVQHKLHVNTLFHALNKNPAVKRCKAGAENVPELVISR